MVLEEETQPPFDGYPAIPEPGSPFTPTAAINGVAVKGRTYGTRLRRMTYSVTLTDLVQECLYEVPTHRPPVVELKSRTLATIAAINANPKSQKDDWADLETPGPPTN